MSEPAIAILPYGRTLGAKAGQVSLSDLIWPLGCPDRLKGGTLDDLERRDHLIVYPKTSLHIRPKWGTRAQISLIMGEPSVIHARHIALLRLSWRRFFRVLTFSEKLIGKIPNAVFFPFGTTWVENWRELDIRKTDMASLIASEKRTTEGHELRHRIVNWVREGGQDVAVMGRGYQRFETKSDGLLPYRYSVVIENVRERNYFSEKLLDAVLCETVPIYWGCPNVGDFFDTAGFVLCESETDIRRAITEMSEEDYGNRLPALRTIKESAAEWTDLHRRAAQCVRAEAAGV